MSEQSLIFVNFTILLFAALVGGMIAHRFKQPVILGYLLIGVAVGPYALKLINDPSLVQSSATIGVSLLMLTLGLEVSFVQLKQVGKVGFLGGVFQILATASIGIGVGYFLMKWTFAEAVLFGIIISLSSTTVCMKILMDRGELDSIHGRIMMAMLILQDVAAVVMIVLVPLLGNADTNLLLTLGKTFGGALLFIAIAIVLGLWVLPLVMGRVGGVRSRELFLLSILVLCLGSALGTQIFGLSTVFGAFLVGLVLRETRFANQALAEVTPLRDIFAAFFFVSLGMLLDPRYVIEHWSTVLIVVGVIFLIKFVVVSGIVRIFGYGLSIATITGLGLFQIGEFSFIIAQSGLNSSIISQDLYTLIIASSIITMLLTPFTIALGGKLYSRLARVPLAGKTTTVIGTAATAEPAAGEVIVAGLGRVGQNIAHALEDAKIPFVSVEIDPEVALSVQCKGSICIYGDASNVHILSKLNLGEARLMVITFPDPVAVLTTAKIALSINPELRIVARAHRERDAMQLKKLGIVHLISPEYEASLEFIRQILLLTGKEKSDIQKTMNRVLRDEDVEEFEPDEPYQPWM